MGILFTLYRKSPKQKYELGKPRLGYAPGREPTNLLERLDALNAKRGKTRNPIKLAMTLYREAARLSSPGFYALWSIMDDENIKPFHMKWSPEELAEKLFDGSQDLDTIEQARVVADDIIRWAGDSELLLLTDDCEEDDLKERGWPVRGYKHGGSSWEALGE